MYEHILIPTDGSDLSWFAVRQGITLAKALNGRVAALGAPTERRTAWRR
jgi:nucleotide-binding universal stress UspA family protein